jgi:hypothetical protein
MQKGPQQLSCGPLWIVKNEKPNSAFQARRVKANRGTALQYRQFVL